MSGDYPDESTSLLTESTNYSSSENLQAADVDNKNNTKVTQKTLDEQYHEYNLSLPKIPILFSLWMGSFLSALDGTVVANIMNPVAEEFQQSELKHWIATSYLLTNTAFQPLYGKLSDITGRKFALLTAHFFFGLGCFLTCFAQNVPQFAIARAICGIGGGGINASSSIAVSDICTTRERGIYQGYANIVFSTGQLLGGPLGGFLLSTVGWRAVFAIQVPLLATCSFFAIRNINIKLSHVPPRHERFTWANLSRIDLGGSITLVFTISGILFLTSSEWNKVVLSVFTLISFTIFMFIELCVAKERIIPFELLKGSFGLSSIATVISSFIIYGDIFRSPIYLQLVQNMGVTMTGLYLIPPSITTALGSLFTGAILRKTKLDLAHCASSLIMIATGLQLFGLVMSYWLVCRVQPYVPITDTVKVFLSPAMWQFASSSIWWKLIYIIALCIVSFGYATLLVATLVSIVFSIERSQQGTITGIFYLWRSIGNVLGASLTLVVFEKSLASKLWFYMFENKKHNPFDFTKKHFSRLISDSSYLRNGPFPIDTLGDLLGIYRGAFLDSYLPNILLAAIGLVITIILYRLHTKKSQLATATQV
ncbi:vacuolar basic amino acid transporter 1 [Monosporozyma unispora]|nr:vacuolar import and degradation protein [Kazachstania unispora]